MPAALLSTKWFAPPPREPRIHRPALNAILSGALAHPLTLVSAPAGYGKTTLVSSWLQETGLPAAWLSLDEEDNALPTFLPYFLTALQKVVPTIRMELLDAPQPPSWKALANLLINEITGCSQPENGHAVLVLDDFHVIQAQPILEMLAFLLEHLPPWLHVILLSRADPLLPLSRLRARGQLVEIRAGHLRFSSEEVTRFFAEVMRVPLPPADVPVLEARTEGWVAGLQLAALALQGLATQQADDIHAFITAFSGSHAYIMDYLVDEVLKQQPEQVRAFLLHTAILDRLCGPLCQAVCACEVPDPETGVLQPLDGQALLETLQQNHLFVIPLDNERRWFRYHHLFRDMLHRRLETLHPRLLPDLYRRASQWCEQNGAILEAVQYARLSGDLECTARLVEQHGCALLMRGDTLTLVKWLDAMDPFILERPWLAMQKAWVLLLTGQPERAEQIIQAGEERIDPRSPGDEARTLQGSFAAARAQLANLQADTGRAAVFARRSLDILPHDNDFSCALRSVATYLLGDASWMNGDLEEARRALHEAVQIALAANNPHMALMASIGLADLAVEQGQFHQAARIYADNLQLAARVDGSSSPFAASNLIGLGRVYYAWNELENAERLTREGIRVSEQWEDHELIIAGHLTLARLERARGHSAALQEALRTVEQLVTVRHPSRRWSVWIGATHAGLWLSQGRPDSALSLLREHAIPADSPTGDTPLRSHLEPAYLVLLRLLLAQNNPAVALAWADRLLAAAQAAHHTGWEVEILVQQALAFQEQANLPRALTALERALALAQPENYRRVFLDDGAPMARLLHAAKAQRMASAFVLDLLAPLDAIGISAGSAPRAASEPPAQPGLRLLAEPLTDRELEILALIESGCSNQDIADRLVISIKTVKRHSSNIFGKLGVKNRTQAVSLARELKLL